MYKIKQIPEDFYVEEVSVLKFDDSGDYSYYTLEKKNYTTSDAILSISGNLRIKPKFINSAGLKDKRAITRQNISIFKGPKKNLDLTDLNLEFLGSGKSRINVGSLEGNFFRIVVRNITATPNKLSVVPNYFDSQRFGINENNHLIGRALIKKDFKEALNYFCENYDVIKHLQKNPNDFIGALRRVPRRELQFYVSAYQSYLWNRCVKEYLKLNPSYGEKFSFIGFNMECVDGEKERIVNALLEEEGISLSDFVVRQFPELSADSHERNIFTRLNDLKIYTMDKDDLNPGMYKVTVEFFLKSGNYATNVIKYMFD